MRWLLFFGVGAQLFANPFNAVIPSTPYEISAVGSTLVENIVSSATGQVCVSETDLHVKGAQDLLLKRTYVSPILEAGYKENREASLNAAAQLQLKGWVVFPHLTAGFNQNSPYFQVRDPEGIVLEFEIVENKGVLKTPLYGCSNLRGEEVSSAFDLRNVQLSVENERTIVSWPDGTKRIYVPSLLGYHQLQQEILPNGKAIHYEYHKQNLKKVYSSDLAGKYLYASIRKGKNNHYLGSNGQTVDLCYAIKEIQGEYLDEEVEETERFHFPVLTKATHPSYSNQIEYNEDMLLSKYDAKAYPISFTYCLGKEQLQRVETLSTPTGTISFTYDPPIIGEKEGSTTIIYPTGAQTVYRYTSDLQLAAIENWLNHTLYNQKLFTYDIHHHISKIEMLDGSGDVHLTKMYECDEVGNPTIEKLEGDFGVRTIKRTYSNYRLVSEEYEDGLTKEYGYLGDTHLLAFETTLVGGSPIRKHAYFYDDACNLVKEVEEGKSITIYQLYQKGPHLHRVEWIEQFDWSEKLIAKKQIVYDRFGNACREVHYGSDNKYAFQLIKTYDAEGHLIKETNPFGQTASYAYDERGRQIQEIPFSGRLSIDKTYDDKGRLITLKEGDHTTHYRYNSSDQMIEKIDYLGLKTTSIYHPLHQKPTLIETYPLHTEISYDAFGRPTEKQDAYGAITKTTYNNLGMPVAIQYPDGGVESFTYNNVGRLIESFNCDGIKTTYDYDPLGRVLSKTIGSRTTLYNYDAYNLLEEIDAMGFSTRYVYNSTGLLSEKNHEGRVSRFSYDHLGFLSAEEKNGRITSYQNDQIGRVVHTSIDGALNTSFSYDAAGNVASIAHEHPTTFLYDPYNRLIEKVDAEGFKTTIEYEDTNQLLIKKITDPSGRKRVEAYNAHGLIIEKEVPGYTVERFSYDLALRLASQDQITFSYTKGGLLASMKDGDLNPTQWTYTLGGQIKTKTNPDGTSLHYSYNGQGELEAISDCYFRYDEIGRLIAGSGFIRKLDPFGNILREEFSNGLSVESTYDHWDRPTKRIFPDSSTVEYEYEGPFLKKVTRQMLNAFEPYSHTYDDFDLAGRLLSESSWFTTSYTYDKNGRMTYQNGPYLKEVARYDSAGNLIQRADHHYTYDGANRLTSESSKFAMKFDAHNHCIEKFGAPVNPPNFDNNGNVKKEGFVYNTFNQLVEAATKTNSYDALGRRLNQDGTCYLYIDQEEIGAYQNGKVKELKIPGHIHPVAIEIDNAAYIPIIDVQGTIRQLVEWDSGEVIFENHCDAFGQWLNSSIPYAYAGKRFDSESKLLYCGKRFYDPSLTMWLTPDPLGPIDQANLYQYLLNNPFNYKDPTGESIFGYVCGLGQMALGGAVMITGVGLEIATFGGYTFAFGFHEAAGAALMTSGAALATYHSKDLRFKGSSEANSFRKKHTPNQQAISELTNSSGKKAISNREADTLLEWSKEYDFPARDDRGLDHWVGGEHIHIGPKHVPVKD